jgi:hypothetical protein
MPLRLPFGNLYKMSPTVRQSLLGLPALAIALAALAEYSRSGSGGEPPKVAIASSASTLSAGTRMREDTELVDQAGHFENVRDRMIFVTEKGGVRFVGLENLGLERIARALANHPGRMEWRISGLVTEYRGTNYLLVRRAVLRTGDERREAPAGKE